MRTARTSPRSRSSSPSFPAHAQWFNPLQRKEDTPKAAELFPSSRPALAEPGRGWSFDWDAVVGDHELRCRATDETGAVQPLEPPWNYRGLGNNAVQRVSVTVR